MRVRLYVLYDMSRTAACVCLAGGTVCVCVRAFYDDAVRICVRAEPLTSCVVDSQGPVGRGRPSILLPLATVQIGVNQRDCSCCPC